MAIRTDLAVELATEKEDLQNRGIRLEEHTREGMTITTVEVLTPGAARELGKPEGKYITIQARPFSEAGVHSEEQVQLIADCIAPLLPPEGTLLIVGLGNEHITPDALGPRCIDLILATRHVAGGEAFAGFRPVAAIAPGVLGQTGIESSDVIASLVERIAPAGVLVIDALAARSLSRLGNTLQISSSGISPGAGVGNNRAELSQATLGVPVISMGIPTVVDCSTLVEDLGIADGGQVHSDMVVTPRDVDLMVQYGAKLLALAINRAAQPELTLEEITYLLA